MLLLLLLCSKLNQTEPSEPRANIKVILGAIISFATELVSPWLCHFIYLKSLWPIQLSSMLMTTLLLCSKLMNLNANCCLKTIFFSELAWTDTGTTFLYFIFNLDLMTWRISQFWNGFSISFGSVSLIVSTESMKWCYLMNSITLSSMIWLLASLDSASLIMACMNPLFFLAFVMRWDILYLLIWNFRAKSSYFSWFTITPWTIWIFSATVNGPLLIFLQVLVGAFSTRYLSLYSHSLIFGISEPRALTFLACFLTSWSSSSYFIEFEEVTLEALRWIWDQSLVMVTPNPLSLAMLIL